MIYMCFLAFCSSGTSAGEPKLMPTISEDLDRRTFLYNLIMPIVNKSVNSSFVPFNILLDAA